MPHRPFAAKLNGRYWSFFVTSDLHGKPWPEEQWGECFPEQRQIHINASRSSGERLEALVHESLHALFPELDEEAVDAKGAELADLIRTYGYRFIREARKDNSKGTS